MCAFPMFFPPSLFAVPVPVVAHGHAHQGRRHGAGLDPGEPGARITGPVPAVRPAAPVPSTAKEDFLGNPLHHLNAGLNHHEMRRDRQLDINTDAHLCMSDGRTYGQGSDQKKVMDFHGRHLGTGLRPVWHLVSRIGGALKNIPTSSNS
jgi:hypothetical protein